jgi:hypothetical protein
MLAKDKIIALFRFSSMGQREFSSLLGFSQRKFKELLDDVREPSDEEIRIVALTFNLPLTGFVNPNTKVIRKSDIDENTRLYKEIEAPTK